MTLTLDLKLKNRNTISEELYKPLLAKGIETLVVDAGARNGMHISSIPQSYAKYAKLLGFEPNEDEFQKLITQSTDAEKAGAKFSQFKNTEYFNCALWNNEEIRNLFITKGPGAVTLMGEPKENIVQKMFLLFSSKSYFDEHVSVKRKDKVECKTLDSLINKNQTIDILKVDVEGAELEIFKGAHELLNSRKILFIKTEFFLTPYFKDSALLGHQQVLLNNYGYRLIDLDFDHTAYTRSIMTNRIYSQRKLKYAGDAYFILDPDRNAISQCDLHRLAIASLAFNFDSLGIDLLREANLISEQNIKEIQNVISRNWTNSRIKEFWSKIPTKIKASFNKLS